MDEVEELSLEYVPSSTTTTVVVNDAMIKFLSVLSLLLDEDVWSSNEDFERFERDLFALWESML